MFHRHLSPRSLLSVAAILAICFAFLTLAAGPTLAQAEANTPDGPVVAGVGFGSRAELQWLADNGYDIWHVDQERKVATVALGPAGWRRLSAAGYRLTVDEARTQEIADPDDTPSFEGYSNVEALYGLLEQTATEHPGLAQVVDYGDSWEKVEAEGTLGYDLLALRLTNRNITGTVPALGISYRPDISITKPVFFLMTGIHAREVTTHEMARRFILYLTDGYGVDADVTWLLDHHEIWVVPTANPDGYKVAENAGSGVLYQRKNTNDSYGGGCSAPTDPFAGHIGVDLNRNASFKWGGAGTTSDPCSQTFRGPNAASEPEEQALEALMAGLFHDQRGPNDGDAATLETSGVMISLHSYSNLVLWPWGWTDVADSPNYNQLAQLGRKMASYNGYTEGQPCDVLYCASGTTDDWAYGTLGVASYTFEIGPQGGSCGGFIPPYSCQDGFWELNLPALLYAAKSARAPYRVPAGPDTLAVTASSITVVQGEPLTLTAQINDMNNGYQNIAGASYWVDVPDWVAGAAAVPMEAADGAFDSATEVVEVVVDTGSLEPGRHTLFVRGQDSAGNWGPVNAVFVEVEEPHVLWLLFVQRP